MTTWDDGFMVNIGPRGGQGVSCTACSWYWGFHDGQALSDVVGAARGHRCRSKLVVNKSLDALDILRLGEEDKGIR